MCAKQYVALWYERSKRFPHLFILVFFSFASCLDSAVSSICFNAMCILYSV